MSLIRCVSSMTLYARYETTCLRWLVNILPPTLRRLTPKLTMLPPKMGTQCAAENPASSTAARPGGCQWARQQAGGRAGGGCCWCWCS